MTVISLDAYREKKRKIQKIKDLLDSAHAANEKYALEMEERRKSDFAFYYGDRWE